MDRISSLPDELLVKILSSSILSKRWECLWMWVPILKCGCLDPAFGAHITERLRLESISDSLKPEDVKLWLGIAVSRCYLREVGIRYYSCRIRPDVLFPGSLYTCISLVTLKLDGTMILVDVPQNVSLPSLKTLRLQGVTYLNEASLRLLLSHCPLLEDLLNKSFHGDNLKALVVIVPSLQSLSLTKFTACSSDELFTPSFKYLKIDDQSESLTSSIEYMPELEDADVATLRNIEKFLKPITNVKRLSLQQTFKNLSRLEYSDDIVFSRLGHLKISICYNLWSKLVLYLLRISPNLRVLKLYVNITSRYDDYERLNWNNEPSSVPEFFETFEFVEYTGRPIERDFLSFLFINARFLKSISFDDHVQQW